MSREAVNGIFTGTVSARVPCPPSPTLAMRFSSGRVEFPFLSGPV